MKSSKKEHLVQKGSSNVLRTKAWIGSSLLLFGRCGLDLTMPAADFATLEAFLLMRSLSKADLLMLVLDFALFGFPLPTWSSASREPVSLAVGLTCPGPVSSLPVADIAELGVLMLLKSLLQPGLLLLTVDFVTSESPLVVQSCSCFGLTLLPFGLARFGSVFSLFVTDCASFDSSPFPRSFAKLNPAAFVLSFAQFGLFLLLHGGFWLGFLSFVSGLS